mmetsp:Transcript_102766/g.265660  ORF Transcript_102766/g.265660 Transcript_102766/m.265660 type:complete len:202 (-) Transcript_102766:120-725(-)
MQKFIVALLCVAAAPCTAQEDWIVENITQPGECVLPSELAAPDVTPTNVAMYIKCLRCQCIDYNAELVLSAMPASFRAMARGFMNCGTLTSEAGLTCASKPKEVSFLSQYAGMIPSTGFGWAMEMPLGQICSQSMSCCPWGAERDAMQCLMTATSTTGATTPTTTGGGASTMEEANAALQRLPASMAVFATLAALIFSAVA